MTVEVPRDTGPQALHVRAEDRVAAWDAVAGAAPSAGDGLGTLADRLAADGLSVEIMWRWLRWRSSRPAGAGTVPGPRLGWGR